jgi:hypothetical protein
MFNRKRIRIRHKEKLSIEEEFDIYWRRNKKKINPEGLITLAAEKNESINGYLLRKRIIIEFLTREKLNFTHFYAMRNATADILEENKNLRSQFLKDLFEIANADNLLELAEERMPEAITELFKKIKSGYFSKRKSLQILIRYFVESPSSDIRKGLWKEIKKYDPSEDDLKYLLSLPMMYSLPDITLDIQKMLKKQNKKEQSKVAEKIKEFIKKLEEKEQKQE